MKSFTLVQKIMYLIAILIKLSVYSNLMWNIMLIFLGAKNIIALLVVHLLGSFA